jgi:hypothetical protein
MSVTAEDLEHLPYLDRNLGRVFTKDCKENVRLFIKEFKETEVGAQLVNDGLAYGANLDVILEAAQAKFDREEVTLPEFTLVARQLWMIGELKKKPVAPIPVDNTPRDKNGKPLTESQLRWSEYRQFSETHNSAERKARTQTDSGYREFVHTNLVREFAEQPVGDAVVAVGTQAVRQDKTKVTQELREFAQAYRLAPTSEVKKLSSPAMNPIGYELYRKNIDLAIAAGLL